MTSTLTELEDLIDSTVSIPTIPTILNEINAVCASEDGSAKDAARIIEKDPAIATKVLRLVNSSFYGLKAAVSSINLACSILGLQVIRNLVVQATVLETFGDGPAVEGFDVGWLWDHSFKTAVAARLLSERTPLGRSLGRDDAYTCGLIHDVGKMVMLATDQERFCNSLRFSRTNNVPLPGAEYEVFGFTHAHVGGLLAQRWKLADCVQAAVLFHHDPPAVHEQIERGFLIRAANTIAHRAATSSGGYVGDMCDDSMSQLELSPEQLADVLATVRSASAQA